MNTLLTLSDLSGLLCLLNVTHGFPGGGGASEPFGHPVKKPSEHNASTRINPDRAFISLNLHISDGREQ
jgi:hypothetical protein